MALPKKKIDNSLADKVKKLSDKITVEDLQNIELNIGNISVIEKADIENHTNTFHDESLIDEKYDELPTVTIEQFKMINTGDLFAAPSEWNLWDQQDDETKFGLMESLLEFGVLQNIIVWRIPQEIVPLFNGEPPYMILAGHNRVDALRKVHYITEDNKFSNVPALVYEGDIINQAIAKRIIDDTNLLMRSKTKKEIAKALKRRLKSLENDPEYMGVSQRGLEKLIAEKDVKSRSYVKSYVTFADCIDEVAELVGDVINFKAGVKFAGMSEGTQRYIYETYYLNKDKRHMFNDSNLLKLKKEMIIEAVDDVFKPKQQNTLITVTYDVDHRLKESIDEYVRKLTEANKSILRG